MIKIREARDADLDDMVEVQNTIHRAGLRENPVDASLIHERCPLDADGARHTSQAPHWLDSSILSPGAVQDGRPVAAPSRALLRHPRNEGDTR